jgi:N-acetylmuramoyl-L-alanine amidase
MKKVWLALAVFLTMGLAGADALASCKLLDIRQWTAPDHTRVVIDLDGPPAYEAPAPSDPLILRVKLPNVILPEGGREIWVNDRVIWKIHVEPEATEGAEITLFLVKPVRWTIFALKPYLDKPDRLVIDVSRPDLEEKEKAERQVSQELKSKKMMIVVLDPGHGGEDPGAIGARKTREKDIVLALAKRLQKALEEGGDIRAFLTRRGDYFVSLEDRIKIAQEYGADLFISLHANASRKRHAHGSSIYCLSLQGASDKAAELLAQKENASDMVGGISLPPTERDLDSILLDLEQTHTINESLHLGGLALSELSRINSIQFTQPRQAGFTVLKAPSIPSILVEAAYITNPVEENFLHQERFQLKLTQAIVSAVKKFMPLLGVKEEGDTVEPLRGKGRERGE